MNATELFLKDGRSAGIYFCEKCHRVAPTQTYAEECCQNYKCEMCGKDTGERSWVKCRPCRNAEAHKKEQERFEKAEKVTEWTGWVFSEGRGGEYFECVEDLIDYVSDEEPIPSYAWTCKSSSFVCANITDVIDRATENAYDDFDPDDLVGLKELERALEQFNESNKHLISYEPDYTKVLLL